MEGFCLNSLHYHVADRLAKLLRILYTVFAKVALCVCDRFECYCKNECYIENVNVFFFVSNRVTAHVIIDDGSDKT